MFMGQSITLTKTIGLFITMNPGYLGRTELRKCPNEINLLHELIEFLLFSRKYSSK